MLNNRFLDLYAREIRTRVQYARRSWDDARKHAQEPRQPYEFFFHIQSFLNSAIAVANLVWPSSKDKEAQSRAAAIRAAIGAADDAPVGLRDVRNGFEHFDERLDKWRRTSTSGNFVDQNFGPRLTAPFANIFPTDVARNYDPATSELAVYGHTTNVAAVMRELESLVERMPNTLGAI